MRSKVLEALFWVEQEYCYPYEQEQAREARERLLRLDGALGILRQIVDFTADELARLLRNR